MKADRRRLEFLDVMSASLAEAPAPRGGLLRVRRLADASLWIAVVLSGLVFIEPSPHELFLAAAIPLWFIAGLKLPRSLGPLVVCLIVYITGGLLSTTQTGAPRFADALMYHAIGLFLAATAIWYAALAADDWRRIRLVEKAYIAGAVAVSLVGILGYFRLLPDSDMFLLYGRARATFKDPNVFGPFLILPSLILARRLMTGPILTRPARC